MPEGQTRPAGVLEIGATGEAAGQMEAGIKAGFIASISRFFLKSFS
jgi:hypothetical protein